MNQLKSLVIRGLVALKRPGWKVDSLPNILISVNKYFTKGSWERSFNAFFKDQHHKCNIVYSRNRMDMYRHFPSADICFLFGFGTYLQQILIKPKMLYFPVVGKEFLNNRTLPEGVIVEQPPGLSAAAVAEYCLAMALLLNRNICKCVCNQAKGKWDQNDFLTAPFTSLSTRTIGVLGVGNIGRAVAEAFIRQGCRVIGCDLVSTKNFPNLKKCFHTDELNTFLEETDILIVALPLTNATRHILGKKELEKLGPSGSLINVGRGSVLVEKELIQALKKGRIKNAAIDVFDREPLSSSSPFYALNNVIITPHIAGNINLFVNDIQKDFIHKASKYLNRV